MGAKDKIGCAKGATMKYPCRSPFLLYNRIDKDSFRIHNVLNAKTYQVSIEFVSFLRQLNGRRDPYTIFPQHSKWYIRQLIRELKHCEMLAPKKSFLHFGFGYYIYPMLYCYFGRVAKILAKLWNQFLMIGCIPILIFGIWVQTYIIVNPSILVRGVQNIKACVIPGIILGVGIATLCHELSHAYVGLAYNSHVFMMGIGIQFFLPVGFVFMDTRHIRNKFHLMQIHAAGIEVNFLLYGIFMGTVLTPFFTPFLMYIMAMMNLCMAIYNLLPLVGLDGLTILSDFLGKKDLYQSALNRIKNPQKVENSSGFFNLLSLVASYLLIILQILTPLSLLVDLYACIHLIKLILF